MKLFLDIRMDTLRRFLPLQ